AGVPRHPAGAQLSQLTVDPPWTPVFHSEKVTLTCQGAGVRSPTRWYFNRQLWLEAGPTHIVISKDHPGTYQCHGPGAGVSPSVTVRFSNDWLVLQVPAQALLEGDKLLLRCRG
ncbi:FCRLB protein, partial [Himantopus himantopus]|nr:FCRLB protein [Himantopus himantopus]